MRSTSARVSTLSFLHLCSLTAALSQKRLDIDRDRCPGEAPVFDHGSGLCSLDLQDVQPSFKALVRVQGALRPSQVLSWCADRTFLLLTIAFLSAARALFCLAWTKPSVLVDYGPGKLWHWAELIAFYPGKYDFSVMPDEVVSRADDDLGCLLPKGNRSKTAAAAAPAAAGASDVDKRTMEPRDSDTPAPKKGKKDTPLHTWVAAASAMLPMPPAAPGDADPRRWIALPYRVRVFSQLSLALCALNLLGSSIQSTCELVSRLPAIFADRLSRALVLRTSRDLWRCGCAVLHQCGMGTDAHAATCLNGARSQRSTRGAGCATAIAFQGRPACTQCKRRRSTRAGRIQVHCVCRIDLDLIDTKCSCHTLQLVSFSVV